MNACKAEAEKNKWNVSIAIVDDAGALLSFERLDGAIAITAEAAIEKARTSAVMGAPSKAIGDKLEHLPGLLKLPGLPVHGGIPVIYQGECVGAIGVSGGLGRADEQVATAGVLTII